MAHDVPHEQLLIVIGASAGGIDALERIASSLPSNLAAPVVIAQHLDPSHVSRLEGILQRRTSLKVTSVDDGATLTAGTIYVVPSGEHVEITGGKVRVSKQSKGARPQPSIDMLFSSAAASYGDRAIGVILTGTGSDGAAGVAAIKEAGGTVVVQDPATAAYPGLPASIPPVFVDLVAPLDAMGSLLGAMIADGEPAARNVDGDMLRSFLTQLRGRSGIDFTQYKMPTITRRLARLMGAAQCRTLTDYMRYLNANPEAYNRLVTSFLIKVTGFFRDPALYAYLREQVFPDVIETARKNKTEIRLWSAGCATGEEPYSIAILLSELLGEELDSFDVRIFATDLDRESISFARHGVYTASALGEMSPELIEKYFISVNGSYRIKSRIRNLTVFGEYDLGQRAPFPRIDVVLCRNVLIYFTKELQQRTLQLFAFSLREGGYLVLGKAEKSAPLPQYFSPVHPVLKVFQRHGERLLIPAPAFADGRAVLSQWTATRRGTRTLAASGSLADAPQRWPIGERLGSFLFDSPIGMVLVDRNYDIQAINQAARAMLGIRGQGVGEDLIHLASSVSASQLKQALDAGFRGESAESEEEFEVSDMALNETKFLKISCYPEKSSGKDGHISAVVLFADDVTELSKTRRTLEKEKIERGEELRRLTRQNEELLARQRSLIESNDELAAANDELRSTNEHLLIAAEEAEAATEEVETLNEEMQATSEELETLNEELQATIEELNTTNEELGARGNELERVGRERQDTLDYTERLRSLLEGGVETVPLPVALVDEKGLVVKTSAMFETLRPLDGALPLAGQKWTDVPRELEVRDGGHSAKYEIRVLPVTRDEVAGKLVVLLKL